jgi:hypothetical protein
MKIGGWRARSVFKRYAIRRSAYLRRLPAPKPAEPCAFSSASTAGTAYHCINFVPGDGITVQAMHMNHRTVLGPRIRVQITETLHRLLAYLGATPAQLAEFENCNRP